MTLINSGKRNLVGFGVILVVVLMFGFLTSASAASSSFSYSGSTILGDRNGQFHHLNKGSAYATIKYHSGTAKITLYRQRTLWLDARYGTITVNSDKTYKFPDKIDVDSSKYWLEIIGVNGSVSGSGTLHN